MEFNYEQLDVTKRVKELVHLIYEASRTFPREELYGMTSQIRRSAVSVLLNIAEGSAKRNRTEFARYLGIATGSLVEVDALMKLAKDFQYTSKETFDRYNSLMDKIYFPLVALRKSVKDYQDTAAQVNERIEHLEL